MSSESWMGRSPSTPSLYNSLLRMVLQTGRAIEKLFPKSANNDLEQENYEVGQRSNSNSSGKQKSGMNKKNYHLEE